MRTPMVLGREATCGSGRAVWKQDAGSLQAPCCSHPSAQPLGQPPRKGCPGTAASGWLLWADLLAPGSLSEAPSVQPDTGRLFPCEQEHGLSVGTWAGPPGGGGRSTQTHTCAHLIPASWPEHLFPTGTLSSAARRPGHWGWSGRGGWPVPLGLARQGRREDPAACCPWVGPAPTPAGPLGLADQGWGCAVCPAGQQPVHSQLTSGCDASQLHPTFHIGGPRIAKQKISQFNF